MKKKAPDPESLSADSLVALAKESHRKVMVDVEKRERQHREKIASLTEAEKRLTAEIATAKELLGTMTKDFDKLDAARAEAGRMDSRDSEAAKADLKSGAITMNQFLARDESEKLLAEEAKEKVMKKLNRAADVIREKAAGIVKLEHELYSVQSEIFNLLSYPVTLLRRSYKDLSEMLDFQFEKMTKDGHSAQSLMTQKKVELLLIEKQASPASSGYTWPNISLEEAYRLRLDPILPREHVPSLLDQLSEVEPGEKTRLTIVYHQPGSAYPGLPLEIREEL